MRIAFVMMFVIAVAAVVPTALAHDLVECDACVAATTEMCAAALQHKAMLGGLSHREYGKKHGKKTKPMAAVLAAVQKDICDIERLRKYTHPPPQLTPKCKAFSRSYAGEITEFFETFAQRDMECRAAVDAFCVERTKVCSGFVSEAVERGSVTTSEFSKRKSNTDAKKKKNKKKERSKPKTYGVNSDL
jgi:hypothetical protein